MTKNKKLLACEITKEQEATLKIMCKEDNRNKSNFVKNLLKTESEKRGLEW